MTTLTETRTPPKTERSILFEPLQVGRYELPHRIVMAPLTRSRARHPGDVPTPLMARYYAQRASAALIIAEASQVSMQGQGYAWTPGVHSRDQIEGWRLVTEAVHQCGGRMFLQLWHVGRISHPSLQPDQMLPVAPSALRPAGEAFIETEFGVPQLVPFITPRALETAEIPYVVRQFERGARNAMEAGFEGVEIHGANGYLIDQFLCSKTNQRTDEYGGSVENRARFLKEVVGAVVKVWGADRVGIRISPLGTFNDIADDDPETTFGYVAGMLSAYRLAYLHVVNPAIATLENKLEPDERSLRLLGLIRRLYRGVLILAGGFDRDTAEEWIDSGRADAIAFGRKFLANPDLPMRFQEHASLNRDDPSTYYGGGAKGYVDYPTLAQERGEQTKPCEDTRWR